MCVLAFREEGLGLKLRFLQMRVFKYINKYSRETIGDQNQQRNEEETIKRNKHLNKKHKN